MVFGCYNMITHEISDAPAPFDDPDADVVIRSRDGVDFRVYRVILSLTSPIFKDMFMLPPPKEAVKMECGWEEREGLPVVRIEENGKTFETFMRYCYPEVEDPILDDLEDVISILEVAKKYEAKLLSKRMTKKLTEQKFLDNDPITVYAFACRYKLKEEARTAAKHARRQPIFRSESFAKGLDYMTGAEYHRLIMYHRSCGALASTIAADFEWLPRTSFAWFKCRETSCTGTSLRVWRGNALNPRKWWIDYMEQIRLELEERPSGETVMDPSFADPFLKRAMACPTCRNTVMQDFRSFTNMFALKIESDIIDHIELELEF